jgi:hypothetical protein
VGDPDFQTPQSLATFNGEFNFKDPRYTYGVNLNLKHFANPENVFSPQKETLMKILCPLSSAISLATTIETLA